MPPQGVYLISKTLQKHIFMKFHLYYLWILIGLFLCTMLLSAWKTSDNMTSKALKIDFGLNKDGQDWLVINDGVMGGLSNGGVSFKKNSVLFQGTVSLENNGGFSSFRAPYTAPQDLSIYKKVTLKYKSKGINCGFTLDMYRPFYLPYFKQNLAAESDEWQVLSFSLKDFKQYRLLKETGLKASQEDLEKIIRIGFITNEKRAGAFEIEIDYILFE